LQTIRITWDEYYATLRRLPKRLKKTAAFVTQAVPDFRRHGIKNVLDLGCGAGRHCVSLAQKGFEVVGVDISGSALRLASKWAKDESLTNVAFVRGAMTSIPFLGDSFGAVVSVSVIHHAVKRDILKTIAEIRRVLRDDGIFLANLISVNDPRYGQGEKVENNTFRVLEAFEKNRFAELHHYFTEREISRLLTQFASTKTELMKDRPHYWKVTARK